VKEALVLLLVFNFCFFLLLSVLYFWGLAKERRRERLQAARLALRLKEKRF
jgi:hypothetical protein